LSLASKFGSVIQNILKPPTKTAIQYAATDAAAGGNVWQFTPEDMQDMLTWAERGILRNIYAFHDEMLARDAHLRALVETSQDYLLEATFAVLPYPSILRRESQKGSPEAKKAQFIADYVEKELRRPEVRMDSAIRALGFGFARGVAGLQVTVAPDEGGKNEVGEGAPKLERLSLVQEIPGQRFGFDRDTGKTTVSLTGDYVDGQDIVAVDSLGSRVCLLEVDAGMPNPARRGYLRTLLNYWLIRNLGFTWWSRFTELYGTPFRQGTYAEGDAESRAALVAILREAGNAGYAVLPEGARIDIVDTFQRISGHSPHQALSEYSGREMSKVILGHAQAIEVQQGTGSVQGSKHSDVIAVRKTNARGLIVAQTIRNGLVWPLVARNFGVQNAMDFTPEVQIVLEQRDSLTEVTTAIATATAAGVTSIPVVEFHRLTGIRMAEANEPTIMPIPMPGQPTPDRVGQPGNSREPVTKPMEKPAGSAPADTGTGGGNNDNANQGN